MTQTITKLKIGRARLQLKAQLRIASSLTPVSPVTIDTSAGNYKFGLDIPALEAVLGGVFLPSNFTQAGVGAVPVSYDAILRKSTFTPEMFGAAGDGVTDDTSSIQRAVNAAGLYGAAVQFKPATYKTTSTITISNSAVALRGSTIGLGTVILFAPTGNTAALWWTSGAAINSYGGLYDFTINTADTSFYKTGVRLTDFSVFTMKNVRVSNFFGGPSMTVTGAAANGSGEIRLAVNSAAAVDPVTPFPVNVSGVLGTTEANHSWKAVRIDATHIDLKGSTFNNAWAAGGTQVAQAASVGCFLEGRELGVFENTQMSGDIGLRIGVSPNQAVNALDTTNFNNSTFTATGTGSCILVDDGVTMTSVSWTGTQSTGEGKDQFRWVSKSDPAISTSIFFENMRDEQISVAGGWHYLFSTANPIYGLTIAGAEIIINGIYARNVKNLLLSGCYGISATNVNLDIDATVENTTLIGCYWYPGSTANLVGQYQYWAGAIVGGAPLPSTGQYGNSNAVSNQFGPTTFNGANRTVGQALFGLTGSVNGTATFYGLTSGAITVQPQNAAGTYNFNLPVSAGTAGQPLLSGGGVAAPMTFGTLGVAGGGTGGTAASGTLLDNIAGFATTGFLQRTGAGAYSFVASGAANGLATLDGGGKLTAGQIPSSLVGAVVYQGTWNATTNSPALASGVGTKGFYYKVGTAGATAIDGINQWGVGDTIIFDGATWDKIDGVANEVISVAGLFGVITSAALKTALALVVGDLTDASANARTFLQAANYAAMKVLLAIGVADIGGFGSGVATALSINVGTTGSVVVQGGAWTAYTSTAVPAAGAITTQTSTSSYRQEGKLVYFNSQITVSAHGTATTLQSITLPVAALKAPSFIGRENAVSGVVYMGQTSAGTTTVSVLTLGAALTLTDGSVWNISGSYEAA